MKMVGVGAAILQCGSKEELSVLLERGIRDEKMLKVISIQEIWLQLERGGGVWRGKMCHCKEGDRISKSRL